MYIESSTFTASTLNLYHNALKSIVFRIAEILLAFAVYKIFSLIAARADLFTTYLMFAEDGIQRTYYSLSRAFTKNGVLIVCFSVMYAIAQLYGTLLWALDAPGYVLVSKNVTAASMNGSLLENPAYIVSMVASPKTLPGLHALLPQAIGANLYEAGTNFTLTTGVERGIPETVANTRPDAFPRISLDSEGFSVSTDTATMVTYTTAEDGRMIPLTDCPIQQFPDDSFAWNCTFNNTFTQNLLQAGAVGTPEVHWDDASDLAYNSRYILPSRENNIWSKYGQGGGTAAMKQLFLVTKGTRRHTFIETAFRATMLTGPNAPFAAEEITDILRRTWTTNRTEPEAPFVGLVRDAMLRRQAANKSYMFGIAQNSGENNITTTQVHWQYLTAEVSGEAMYSMIRISLVNITLIRSEDILTAPVQLEPCDASTMNMAYGGKLTDTDCQGSRPEANPQFFGEVDTSAVLIVSGLGDGRSNISAKALDEDTWQFFNNYTQELDDLLIARGYITSVDANLVTLATSVLRPAISYLQMFLVLVALLLAFLTYLGLRIFATPHWCSSLLQNIVATLHAPEDTHNRRPAYIWTAPDVRLEKAGPGFAMLVDGKRVALDERGSPTVGSAMLAHEKGAGVEVVPLQDMRSPPPQAHEYGAATERDSFLPRQGWA